MGVQSRQVGYPVSGAASWMVDGLAIHRGGGHSDWWHPKAVYALDFVNARAKRESAELTLTSAIALIRDSAAMLADRTGVMHSFVAHEPALISAIGADFEGSFTNKLRNPLAEGGTIGTIGYGGALPTNYNQPNAGASTEFVGTGTDSAGAYQDWRIFGTASASAWRLRFENTTNAAASSGQGWGFDLGVTLIAGTPVSVTPEIVICAGGTAVTTVAGNAVMPDVTLQRLKAALVVADATVTNVRPQISLNIVSGASYNFTLRLYAPKLCQIAVIEGPELLVNGDVASDTVWSKGAGATIASGKGSVVSAGALAAFEQSVATGASAYKYTITVQDYVSGTVRLELRNTSTATGPDRSANGTYTDYIAGGAGNTVARYRTGTSTNLSIDNLSLKLVTPGYLPAFPILPPVGAPGDSIRAADVAQPATFAWFARAGLTSAASELVATTFSHVGDGARRCLFEYSDGTAANVICGSVNASDHAELTIIAGGVVQTVTTLTASVGVANAAFAFGWSSAGGYVTNGVETQVFGSITLPTLTQKRVGGGVIYPALNDVLRKLQACTLLTSAEAMSWAASA